MRYYKVDSLIHYVCDTLDYPPPDLDGWVLEHLLLYQEIHVVLYLIPDDLCLGVENHIDYTDCVLLDLLGMVRLQQFEDVGDYLRDLIVRFILVLIGLRCLREGLHKHRDGLY